MGRFLVCCGLLCLASCGDESYDNVVDLVLDGESYTLRTNDGSCEFRNGSLGFSCALDTGSNPEGDDFVLTVNDDEEIVEGTYTDTIDTSNPGITIRLWIQGPGDDAPVVDRPGSRDSFRFRDGARRRPRHVPRRCDRSAAATGLPAPPTTTCNPAPPANDRRPDGRPC